MIQYTFDVCSTKQGNVQNNDSNRYKNDCFLILLSIHYFNSFFILSESKLITMPIFPGVNSCFDNKTIQHNPNKTVTKSGLI